MVGFNGDTPIVVVTGATSGIGFETARGLAANGMQVIGLGRDADRIAQTRATLEAEGLVTRWVRADFASITETRAAAAAIAEIADHVDILVNNAGALLEKREVTGDGMETMFQVNHISPFVLTTDLLPSLHRATAPHVITLSSIGHMMIDDMRWDDLQMEHDFAPLAAYAQSKLANILFTRELTRRFGPDGLVASAVHPGLVASRFPQSAGEATQQYYAAAEQSGEALSNEQGADTVIWLARERMRAEPSGGYFFERTRTEPSPAAQNAASSTRLWDISVALTTSR